MEREQLEKYPHPELSIYYHPVFNPLGAPPPGKPMVYKGTMAILLNSLKESGFMLEGTPGTKVEALEYHQQEDGESEESEEETPSLNIPGLQDLPQIKPESPKPEPVAEVVVEKKKEEKVNVVKEPKKEAKLEIEEEFLDVASIPLPEGPPPAYSRPPIPRGNPPNKYVTT